MKLNAYLNFDGTCEEAFRYYEQHLGAKVLGVMKFSQMPDAEKHVAPGWEDKVLHGTLALADTLVHASDIPGKIDPMRSAYLSLAVDSTEEAERVYAALIDGGQVCLKMEETFFAYRFGQLRDRFGVNWMVLHQKPMLQG